MCAGRNHIMIISMINNDDDDDDYEKLFEQRKTCSVRWADGMMAAAAGEGGRVALATLSSSSSSSSSASSRRVAHHHLCASISFTAIDTIIVIIVVFLCPFCGICQKSSTMVGSLGHRQLCPNQRMKRRELKQDHDATIQHGRLEWKARADNAITLKRFMQ